MTTQWEYREERERRALAAMRDAEAKGLVADSKEVRLSIIRRIQAGEITIAEGQAELNAIQRAAKKNGQVTRSQAYRSGR